MNGQLTNKKKRTQEERCREASLDPDLCHQAARELVDERMDRIPTADRGKAADTLLVLFLLQHAFPERESLWRRAARKAERWLAHIAQRGEREVEQWIKAMATSVQGAG